MFDIPVYVIDVSQEFDMKLPPILRILTVILNLQNYAITLWLPMVLGMSELLNKSGLDSISIWLFGLRIFCSLYVLYYGCISLLSFSEICHKITSNHLLQLEIGENWSKLPFYHVGVTSACYVYQNMVILMILHTNFWHVWWFRTQILENDRASSAFDLIAILSVWSKRYRYELGGNDNTPTQMLQGFCSWMTFKTILKAHYMYTK